MLACIRNYPLTKKTYLLGTLLGALGSHFRVRHDCCCKKKSVEWVVVVEAWDADLSMAMGKLRETMGDRVMLGNRLPHMPVRLAGGDATSS